MDELPLLSDSHEEEVEFIIHYNPLLNCAYDPAAALTNVEG